MKKIILCCLIVSLLTAACSRKTEKEEKPGEIAKDISSLKNINSLIDEEIEQLQNDDFSSPVKIKIYQIHEYNFKYQTVELSRENFTENVINYLDTNPGLHVKKIWYEGTRLIVDFDQSMITRFDGAGSTGGLHLSNSILHTFSSFPDVTEMKFLFDGQEDLWGDHFSFEGIFPAGSHVWTGPKITESDLAGLWESEDNDQHIFYFIPDNVYKEGGKESEWFKTGKWELAGNLLTLTIKSGAYEELENPAFEHIIISMIDDKLTLTYSDVLIRTLVRSDYIKYL